MRFGGARRGNNFVASGACAAAWYVRRVFAAVATMAVRRVEEGRSPPRPRASLVGVTIAVLVGSVGCGARVLPPPPAPGVSERLPEIAMPTEGPRAGHGFVVLDVPGEPARVSVCDGARGLGGDALCSTRRALCARLPCVAELPVGVRRVVFESTSDASRESTADVTVGREVVVVRHALGLHREHRGLVSAGSVSWLVGGPVAVLSGAVLVGNELSTFEGESSAGPARGAAITGLVVGASLVAVGVTLSVLGRPETQKGATTTTPWPGARAGGLSFRF